MTARRIITAALARRCQREYERDEGRTPMKAIAARHSVSLTALRKWRVKLGLPRCAGPRGPARGSNYGGSVRRFEPDPEEAARWNVVILPGWRVHGEASP